MKWFRSNIKHGSRLALFALTIQFVMSFGHFHAVAAQAAPAIQSGLALSDHANGNGISAQDTVGQSLQQAPLDHDSDQTSHDPCELCAVIAMASTGLSATPPLLLLPQVTEFLYLTTDAGFVHLNPARVAFQPRAPPIS
jgi:hypothetical protein